MNKIITTLLFVFVLSAVTNAQEKSLNLSGTVKGSTTGTVYLHKFNNKIFETIDSVAIENGTFRFDTAVQLPELYGISIDKNQSPMYLFLEDAPIAVALDSANNYSQTVVEGSDAQNRFKEYNKRSSEPNITEFISEDPTSIVSAYVLYRNFSYRLTPKEIIENVNLLDASLQPTQYVSVLKDLAKTMEGVAIGNKAPDFQSTTPDGQTVRFSDQLGKGYILLDFWAAWCGPCRRENPNVVAAFDQYKDKGFTVYGVSLDKTKAAWVKAIQDDQLNWTQVSDLAFWKSEAAALYGVRAIPSNFLIAPNGEIIGRDLKGEALQKKLKELLD